MPARAGETHNSGPPAAARPQGRVKTMAMESCAVCEIPIRIAVSAGLMDTVIPDL